MVGVGQTIRPVADRCGAASLRTFPGKVSGLLTTITQRARHLASQLRSSGWKFRLISEVRTDLRFFSEKFGLIKVSLDLQFYCE